MPFYVTYDSADVWVHPKLFSLNSQGTPKFVGGVPPTISVPRGSFGATQFIIGKKCMKQVSNGG